MTTNEGTFSYEYDVLGQLVGVIHPDGRVVSYDYDEAGNQRQVIGRNLGKSTLQDPHVFNFEFIGHKNVVNPS